MTDHDEGLFVRSHVARDLLQNAGLFKTDKLVVWEYVSNGLQYVDQGTSPVVKVVLDSAKKRISILDNGRGMDWEGLKNFFVMHGENIDRKEGRPGRGRYGTGKSAAFGIAELLRLTTIRNGKRSKVELRRSDIAEMSSEDPIPVNILEKEVPTFAENGTVVEIEGIKLRSLDQAGIIHYTERHLARWAKNVTVFVNNHECEFSEPPVAAEYKYVPDSQIRNILGDVELIIKVSKSPLEEDIRGIAIFSNGVWHETTLAGSEGREMSQYIFGEIDVPRLDEDKSPIAPMDVSRSMHLNLENEIVRAIYGFIGLKIDEVRRDLVEKDKARKAEQDAKRLAREATEIAKVINEDFAAFRDRVAKVRAKMRGRVDLDKEYPKGGGPEDDLIFGEQIPAVEVSPFGDPGKSEEPRESITHESTDIPDLNPQVEPMADASKKGQPKGDPGTRLRPAGGFRIEFKPMGVDSFRAQYVPEERTIYINLEHPQLVAARGTGPSDDPTFRRLAYEVAFSEYAIALAQELARRDEYIDPTDPIFDIRETLNRVARKGAILYA